MAENEVYDLVIVGGGPGGLSAGIYAMRVFIFTGFVPNNRLVPAGIRMDHDGYVETMKNAEPTFRESL